MSHMMSPRVRGALRMRADATQGDFKDLIDKLNASFEAFKDAQNQKIEELRKGFDDVVQSEKVDKINASVTELQSAVDDLNAQLAAAKIGPAGDPKDTPEKREHAAAFDKFFRKGVEGNLRELEVKAAATSSSDPDGGYTVTDEMETAIDRVLENVSPMRGLATVRQVSTATYKKLVTISGAAAGWVGEKDARPETSTPQLSELAFPTMELYANPAATQGLLDDSAVNIADWLADEVAMEFAEQEGDAYITGDGVNKPRGITQYDTVANASWSWGKIGFTVSGAAGDFAASDPSDAFLDLIYSLRRGHRANARWLMNDLTTAQVRKFKDGQGNYIWQPSTQAGQPAILMGYPHETDDFMPDVGANAFPVAFADFRRAYVITDRVGIRVLRDPYTNKPYIHFYTTKRVGGGVQNFQAIKLMKIST